MDFFINANLGGRHHGWSGHHGGGFHAFATFDLSSLLGDHDAPEGHVSRRFRDELQNAAGSYAAAATAGPTDSRDIDRAGRAIDALSQLSGDDGKIRIPPGRDGGVEIPMGDSSTIFIPAGAYSTTDLAKAIGKEVQAPQNVQDAVVKAIADRANGTNDAGDAITRERHLRDSGATQPDGNGHDDTPAPSSTAARLANVELNYQSIIDAKTPLDRQYATRVYYKSLTTLADSNGNIPIDNTYDGKIGDKTIHVPASPDGKPYSRIEFTAMMGKQFGTENLTPAVISLANSWQEQPGEPPLPSRSTSSTQPDSTTPSTPPPATGTPTPLHPDPAPDQPLARDSKSVDYPTINAMGDAPAAMALLTTGTIPYTDGQGKPQANLSDALRAQAAFGHWTNALKGVNPAGMDPKQQDDAFVKALGFTSKEQAGQAFASIATAYDAADDKGKQDILKSAKDFYTAAQTAYPAVGNDIQKGILDRLQNPPQSGLQLKGIMDSLKGMLDKFSQAIQASVGPDTTTPNASTTPDGTGTPAPAGTAPDGTGTPNPDGTTTPAPAGTTAPAPGGHHHGHGGHGHGHGAAHGGAPAARSQQTQEVEAIFQNLGFYTGGHDNSFGNHAQAKDMDGIAGHFMNKLEPKAEAALGVHNETELLAALNDPTKGKDNHKKMHDALKAAGFDDTNKLPAADAGDVPPPVHGGNARPREHSGGHAPH